jgi:hypothetical protein
MSFILRTVDEHLINYHTYLGEEYDVVTRERSPEYFESLLIRDPFGGDKDKVSTHVSYWGGYKYIQEGEHAYIMTGKGETFENLTPPKRFQKKTEEKSIEQPDPFLRNWSKLVQGAGRRISINKNGELRIVGESEFGRSFTPFDSTMKEMESRRKCLIFPMYDGSLLIKGYTAQLRNENEILKMFSKFIVMEQDVDSNGPYYRLKTKGGIHSTKFPVFDEHVMSLVGYGLLFDMEDVHTIVSSK